MRGQDLNLRPSGYEPDELPGCSTPRWYWRRFPKGGRWVDWKTWRRPTLPCLETQYHGRWGISRPSSGWDRVQAPRQSHQVVQSTLEMVVSLQSLVVKRLGWKVLAICRVRCVAHSRLLQTDDCDLATASGDDFHAWCRCQPSPVIADH